MPFAVFKGVYSVSSEDSTFSASNLLKSDPAKKWKTSSNGEKSASVVLQFEKSELVTGVDIGNEHSAFIEVLVGKNGCSTENFKELILTSSFMTPVESKNSTNFNRIRCFNQKDESWIKNDTNEKWDLIKFICTQPFNKYVQYGLSLVKVHVAANEPKEIVPKAFIQQQHNANQFIGKFKLRDDSDEDEEGTTTLFNRWKNQSNTPDNEKKISTAASIRDASRHCDENPTAKKIKFNKHSSTTNSNESTTVPDRNRNNLFYNKDDDNPDERLEKKIAIDRESLNKKQKVVEKIKKEESKTLKRQGEEPTNKTPLFNKPTNLFVSKMKNILDTVSSDDEEIARNEKNLSKDNSVLKDESSRKRVSSEKLEETDSKRKKRCDQYKTFDRLLEEVVLVISGIQNPHRADIRSKALALGARYKPDWDSKCTHLVCAFKNTPKYIQVKNMKGKIITKSWIDDCYNLKKRLPWRRYALDSNEAIQPESEDEILDISMQPELIHKESRLSPQPSTSTSPTKNYKGRKNLFVSDSEEDTESIQKKVSQSSYEKLETNEITKLSPIKDKNDIKTVKNETKDIYDATTDEDDFTKMKKLINVKDEKKNFFENFKFFLDLKLTAIEKNKLIFMIEEFGGTICQLEDDDEQINYIISNYSELYKRKHNFKGEIVKPLWVYECNDMECLIPTERYLI